jgi:hypothetical protein
MSATPVASAGIGGVERQAPCSSALERGLHALRSVTEGETLDVKAYAVRVGRDKERRNIQNEVMAARVASAVENVFHANLSEHYMKLVEIHAAPAQLWHRRRCHPALLARGSISQIMFHDIEAWRLPGARGEFVFYVFGS